MNTPHHVEGWPCPSLDAANRLRRIFRGDLTASPGRALFASTGAPDLTETRMCAVCDQRPADDCKTTCRRCRQEAVMAKVMASRPDTFEVAR